jgi:hypothetical protein
MEKMWALEILFGHDGLLMNVIETHNIIMVSSFRRRKDLSPGPVGPSLTSY